MHSGARTGAVFDAANQDLLGISKYEQFKVWVESLGVGRIVSSLKHAAGLPAEVDSRVAVQFGLCGVLRNKHSVLGKLLAGSGNDDRSPLALRDDLDFLAAAQDRNLHGIWPIGPQKVSGLSKVACG